MAKKVPAERLVAASAIRAGFNYDETNDMLKSAGFEHMNRNSYKMMKKQYIPSIEGGDTTYSMREHVLKPRRYNQLKD